MANNKKDPGDIYCGLNMSTGKCYVGYTTKSLKIRLDQHMTEVRRGSTKSLHQSIRDYGIDNFIFWVIDKNVPGDQLKEKERYYVSLYNTEDPHGYNMTKGGDISPSTNPKVVAKISQSVKELWQDPDYRERQLINRKKTAQDPERNAKLSESIKLLWEDPDYREKHTGENHWLNKDSELRAKHKAACNTEESRRKRSEGAKNRRKKEEKGQTLLF